MAKTFMIEMGRFMTVAAISSKSRCFYVFGNQYVYNITPWQSHALHACPHICMNTNSHILNLVHCRPKQYLLCSVHAHVTTCQRHMCLQQSSNIVYTDICLTRETGSDSTSTFENFFLHESSQPCEMTCTMMLWMKWCDLLLKLCGTKYTKNILISGGLSYIEMYYCKMWYCTCIYTYPLIFCMSVIMYFM